MCQCDAWSKLMMISLNIYCDMYFTLHAMVLQNELQTNKTHRFVLISYLLGSR